MPPNFVCGLLPVPARDTARAMSQESMETVKRAIAAVNERDVEGYLCCCTKDIELSTPAARIGGV